MDGFKKFIMRGNVVDLAVGIAIGAAFNNIVSTFVRGIVTPLTGAELRIPDFSTLNIRIHGEVFAIGDVVNSLFSFMVVAIVIYYFVVLPVNKLAESSKKKEERAHPAKKKCVECLSDMPIAAKRCAHCASVQKHDYAVPAGET